LGRFLLVSQILPYDFALNLSNIPAQKQKQISYEIIKDFKRHLEEKRVSQNTIKNYLSDIRQFLTWLETNYV
jgi:site-specific recombinase XerD